MGFARAIDVLDRLSVARSSVFEAGQLPESERERLCRQLLAEFGVPRIHQVRDGELIHGCVLPFGRHKDQDRNPTASLNYKKLTYKCFGCDAGGGLLWFIGLCRGTSATEARGWLDEQTGLGADEQSLASLLAYFDAVYNPQREVHPPMPKMSAKVLEPWLAIHPYMTEERGCTEETLMQFLVGYAPDYRVRLTEDRFIESSRIVIPHFWQGNLVGWQTRRLANDGTSKYLNSPDFPKDTTIFNYDARRPAVVVESPLSVLAMYHRTTVLEGTFSASVTDKQIRLLATHDRVILWFDNDDAGWKATEKVGAALEDYSSVWVVDNPYNGDPGDLVKAGMIEEALQLIAEPIPYALWRPPTTLIELPKGV
jgi:DNA primase